MKFPGVARRIVMMLAVSALLLGLPLAAAASASSATTGTGWIRLAHLSPATAPVDVYLYSFGDSSAHIVLHHVAYGTVSPYEAVTAGDYSVAMRPAGAPSTSQPVLSTSVTIVAGHAYTVAGVGPRSGLLLQVMDDDLTTPAGKALVRVIQASLKQQTVGVSWDGMVVTSKLPFDSVTSYQAVTPGTETVSVTGPARTPAHVSRSRPAPCTRSWSSTEPAAWRSPTSRTQQAAAGRPRAAPRPGSAAPRRTGRAHRCRGLSSSEPGRCSP